ncbi:60Kd inner membrane protein-domain-containing protein [Hypoxylon sp. NC1633]|nr:60Kd inner membrane protein-domain-containing protein [Hypoxylon sp. NC1633]
MLPSRGVSRSGIASALGNCWSARSQSSRPLQVPIRLFSQAQSQSILQSRAGRISSTPIPSTSTRFTLAATASGVFAQRSGASRTLSLWPFSSKQPSPGPLEGSPPAGRLSEGVTSTNSTSVPPVVSARTPTDTFDPIPHQALDSFSDSHLVSILDIPEQIGYLKSLGLDFGWGPTTCCEWLLEHVYIYTGLPWWFAIAAVAVMFRAALFIPSLTAAKHQALMQQMTRDPAFLKARQEIQEAQFLTRDRAAMMQAYQKMALIKKKHGAKPMASFIGILAIPFSYGVFRVVRGMAAIPVPSMETGGVLWFTDLTVHDPYFILPLASIGLAIVMFRQNTSMATDPMSQGLASFMKYGLPPLMFICTAWLPAGLQWFFLVLSCGTVLQTASTFNPGVRRWAGIPPLPSSSLGPAIGPAATPIGVRGTPIWQPPMRPAARPTPEIKKPEKKGVLESATAMVGNKKMDEWKKAQEYEERRAREEKEKAYRRMDELERKRTQKKRSR